MELATGDQLWNKESISAISEYRGEPYISREPEILNLDQVDCSIKETELKLYASTQDDQGITGFKMFDDQVLLRTGETI